MYLYSKTLILKTEVKKEQSKLVWGAAARATEPYRKDTVFQEICKKMNEKHKAIRKDHFCFIFFDRFPAELLQIFSMPYVHEKCWSEWNLLTENEKSALNWNLSGTKNDALSRVNLLILDRYEISFDYRLNFLK